MGYKIKLVVSLYLLISTTFLYASDAYIKTDQSIGQGFLFERKDICYLATPTHVVEDATDIQFMTADRKTHKAEIFKNYDVDLTLLKVPDAKACLHKQEEATTDLSARLKIYLDGVLKSRLSDGSTLQTKVTVTQVDDTEYLQIRTRKKSDILKQGYSGSTLYIADQSAGILLEVDEDNFGYIYRQDAIARKLQETFGDASEVKVVDEGAPPQVGELKGEITLGQVMENAFSWERNSPILISAQGKKNNNVAYQLRVLDASGSKLYQEPIDGRYDTKRAFTPPESGIYTIQLTGVTSFGEFDIKVDQYTLDADLRGMGNIVEAGDLLSGKIAPNAIAEYKYSGQANSPILISAQGKNNNNVAYQLRVLDASGSKLYQEPIDGRYDTKRAFTPPESEIYTIQLTGVTSFGEFDIKVDQYTLDADLRGMGNIVEAGDLLSGKIAPNAIAEYKYSGQANSPILISAQGKKNNNVAYQLRVLDASGSKLYQEPIDGRYDTKRAFTPPESGIYTIQLTGVTSFGEFDIKVDQYTLDADLRGMGNIVEAGDLLSGKIAPNAIAEYKYSGQANSPILISAQGKKNNNVAYQLRVLDASGSKLYQEPIDGRYDTKRAFTPPESGTYIIQLTGVTSFGEFDIKVDQYTLDADLRGMGNIVEAGDLLSGKIAPNAIAEYKYSGQANSPILISAQGKKNNNVAYRLRVLDASGSKLYQEPIDGRYDTKRAFTPPESGIYKIQLIGVTNFGEYNLKVDM